MNQLAKWKRSIGAVVIAASAGAGVVATTSGVAFAGPTSLNCAQGTGSGPSLGAHSNPLASPVEICNDGKSNKNLPNVASGESLNLKWYIQGSPTGVTANIPNATFVLVWGCSDGSTPSVASSSVAVSGSSSTNNPPHSTVSSTSYTVPQGICMTGTPVVTNMSYFTADNVYTTPGAEVNLYWKVTGSTSNHNSANTGGHDWVGEVDPNGTPLIPALGGAAPLGAGLLVIAGGSLAIVATRNRRRRSVASTTN